jgi:hypothetical protein
MPWVALLDLDLLQRGCARTLLIFGRQRVFAE